ncbi:hypothetical protein MesoLjLc_56470 [Mesorhizobium sp. L-8-10]|uniref:DUF2188 domain-containing protein n=1 Tax=unclassified Mesorhizobium TaxID=325217 RepID=UPI001925361C|nr:MULTISPECIES: DUF2188 domain-containing protein [unclassified Mesorhizobium]BCH25721.1 hypothetical protein MesoLjLb_55060 [Mesorhizobium sp. L-8-3]BCH33717.1 hypothetical protein MesoLjLc_56470 [Mesorhizobium sp. L-8-10]
MVHVTYHIVEHDGGWAYKLDGAFSETFRTHEEALKAAQRAAGEQHVSGKTTGIVYQDGNGEWHEEVSRGDDRPQADVDG